MPVIEYEEVEFANVMAVLERHRGDYARSHRLPFIVGDGQDRARLEELIEPPADGGRAIIEASKTIDVAEGLRTGEASFPLGSWPREASPQNGIQSLFDSRTRAPRKKVHLGFVQAENSWDVFAVLGFGGWNECPGPAAHVAMHRYWCERYSCSPIAIGGDVVECYVPKPTAQREAALVLAREQSGYCPDIVAQGTGTLSNLAASLLGARFWYFWWD